MSLAIGDRVRRKNKHPRWTTGTVVDYDAVGGVIVRPDTYTYPAGCAPKEHEGAGSFPQEHFVKIERGVPFVLEHGDKVVNLSTGREGRVLLAPVTKALKVYDVHPPFRDGVPARSVEEYEFHRPGTYDLVKAEPHTRAKPW